MGAGKDEDAPDKRKPSTSSSFCHSSHFTMDQRMNREHFLLCPRDSCGGKGADFTDELVFRSQSAIREATEHSYTRLLPVCRDAGAGGGE